MTKITRKTHECLQQKLNELISRRRAITAEKAEAGAGQDGWHDEHFQRSQVEEMAIQGLVDEMLRLMADFTIIDSPIQSERVMIGNIINVRFNGEKDTVRFLVDGYAVEGSDPPCISASSPAGKALLGARAGETRSVKIGAEITRITVIGIDPP